MMSAASPGKTPVPFCRHAYFPVSMENLDGVQVEDVAYAEVKRMPAFAMLSMCGVWTAVAPLQEMSP